MTDALVAQSRQIIRKGSKSFYVATRLFDASVRDDTILLYAWCRHCDDVIDGQYLGHGPIGRDPGHARAALDRLYELTNAALNNETTNEPVFEGLRRIVRRHDMPHEYPLDLLAGFAMDVDNRRYETLPDMLEYCYHVAGVVGVMMAWIMGLRDPADLRRACDLGIAFQLTNIARDVLADAFGDRVYLPQSWLRESGLEPDAITEPRNRAALFAVIERIVAAAEPYYESAQSGLGALRFRSAWAVAAAWSTYRTIGLDVVKRGPTALHERTVVSRERRLWRILTSAFRAAAAVGTVRVNGPSERPADLWAKW